MTYRDELVMAMGCLASRKNTIFVGQAVEFPGTFMYETLSLVPAGKRLEMPVAEQFQLQFCIGLAQAGYIPICIYPRQNFMLYALGDIVNTLDKLETGKVIIRVASGTTKPVFPGIQHVGDYRSPIVNMVNKINVSRVSKGSIVASYKEAFASSVSSILVEHGDLYDT